MKICILCNSLRHYAGAERVVYELAQQIKELDYSLDIGCIDPGDFYFHEMEGIWATDKPEELACEYDVILCFHWPTFGYFFPDFVRCKKIVNFCLSPYEPTEFPNLMLDSDVIAFNSIESKESFEKQAGSNNLINKELVVFPNSLNIRKYDGLTDSLSFQYKKTLNILLVSNHVPEELEQALSIFKSIGFFVDIIGIDYKTELIDEKIVSKYDLVISIGYTVVMAIACKVPVYVYDHVGGRGFLTGDIYQDFKYNFSGRPYGKKSPEELFIDIISNYHTATQNINNLFSHANYYNNINKNVENILSHDSSSFKEYYTDISLSKFSLSHARMLRTLRFYENEYYSNENKQKKELAYAYNKKLHISKHINNFIIADEAFIKGIDKKWLNSQGAFITITQSDTDISQGNISIVDFDFGKIKNKDKIYTNLSLIAFSERLKTENIFFFVDNVNEVLNFYCRKINYLVKNKTNEAKLRKLKLMVSCIKEPRKHESVLYNAFDEAGRTVVTIVVKDVSELPDVVQLSNDVFLKIVYLGESEISCLDYIASDEKYHNPTDRVLCDIISSSDNIISYDNSIETTDIIFSFRKSCSQVFLKSTGDLIDNKLSYFDSKSKEYDFLSNDFILFFS